MPGHDDHYVPPMHQAAYAEFLAWEQDYYKWVWTSWQRTCASRFFTTSTPRHVDEPAGSPIV